MRKLLLLLVFALALPIGMLAAGTTWQEAIELSQGGSSKGSLSKDVTVQWFKIVVPEDGDVTIKVTPSGDLGLNYTTLYAKDSQNEMHNRGNHWGEGSFTANDCAAGTYYVEVKRNSGSGKFTITYSFKAMSDSYKDDTEPTDTWQKAKKLTSGKKATGHLGYQYYNDRDEVDWYKISVPENGTVKVTVIAHGDLALNYTTLYAKDSQNEMHSRGNVWGGNEKGNGILTTSNCSKGTYYIEVKRNSGVGGYTIRYDFTAMSASYADDTEPNDTWQKAQKLTIGKNTTGHLGYLYHEDRDDVDWYKVDVPENGTVKVSVIAHGNLGLNYTTLYAKDSQNEMHSRGSVWGGDEKAKGVLTVANCAKGTYYLEVKRNSGEGGYSFKCNFSPLSASYADDTEPNSTWQKAQELKRGNTITGHLGYQYYNDCDDVDWFKIEVPRNGTVKLTNTHHDNLGLNYTTIYAKDSQNGMHSRGNCWSDGSITVPDAAPGTYYVEVKRNSGEGAYSLQYAFEQNTYATDKEPNNNKSKALSIKKGATVAGHLGYFYHDDRDDVDWYTFKLTAKSDVTFTYQGEGSLGFNYVTLYNSEQKNLASTWGGDDKNKNSVSKKDLEAGTYYVEVKRNGGQGYYLLAYATKIGTVAKQEPLPDEPQDPQGGTKTVKQDGTTFEVDDTNKTVTIKDVTPDDQGDVYICRYPGPDLTWKILIDKDIFNKIPGKNVTIDYLTPPEVTGTIPKNKVKDKTLHVPAGTKQVYTDDSEWGKFGSIKDDNSVGSSTNLIAWMSETEKHYYNFVEKPKITISSGKYVVTTTTTTVTYEYGKVLKFTLDENGSETAVSAPVAAGTAAVERRGESVVFTGCKPGSPVCIYNVGGQVVGTLSTDGDGRAEVVISDLKTGVYVVKADSVTIKIAKR